MNSLLEITDESPIWDYETNSVRFWTKGDIVPIVNTLKGENLSQFVVQFKRFKKNNSTFIFDLSTEPLVLDDWIYKLRDGLLILKKQNYNIEIWVGDRNIKNNVPPSLSQFFKFKNTLHSVSSFCIDVDYLHNRSFEKKFLIPMARVKLEREWMYKKLIANKLVERNSIYSFNAWGDDDSYPTKPITTNKQFDGKSVLSIFEISKLSKITFCNVVFETIFFNEKRKFLSEKIFHPIKACQPFILVSQTGELKYLKSLGFKTFDKWWDESYDDEVDDWKRLDKIWKIIEYINQLQTDKLKKIHTEMISVLRHNYYHMHELSKLEDFSYKGFMGSAFTNNFIPINQTI